MKRNKSVINDGMNITGASTLMILFFNQQWIQEHPAALQTSCPLLLMS